MLFLMNLSQTDQSNRFDKVLAQGLLDNWKVIGTGNLVLLLEISYVKIH